ncbi:MAG: glycogen debranching N-terminal domain-containing protein [Actinomycetales bacterium]
MSAPRQPFLHEAVVVLSAPSQAWSGADGDIGTAPIHGFYHSDARILSTSALRVGGARPECIAFSRTGAAVGTFVSVARNVDGPGADPRVRVDRCRQVRDGCMAEEITVSNALPHELSTVVEVRIGADFSRMHEIKAGLAPAGGSRTRTPPGVRAADGTVVFSDEELTASFRAPGAELTLDATQVTARWPITVPAGGRTVLNWQIEARDASAVVRGAAAGPEWDELSVRTGDQRLAAWVHTAVNDLTALRMATTDAPVETFLGAGAPWFLTLFGRDSIWAARFLLPLGTGLAASTLRVLARLQGTKEVPETAEQPGKIMHELRPGTQTIPAEGVALPPLYYGTVDATALWIVLLHEAWRWGMADADVEPLLANLEAALAWMRDYGDSDGDGFLEYVDESGHGLANQGWKDSGDSIQWRDGTLSTGPIALCEVQAYAYQAAVGGAELLDHFGRAGGAQWRSWAAALKQRFADSFWIDSPGGAYPAVALDAAKHRVDTVTSNIGHLLGTGILDPAGEALVARRLVSPELNSGFGLRTMSTDSAGYWPLGYHSGSVWTHDTAIAIAGLGRAGFGSEAASLIDGLLAAAVGFGYRMPELHSGDAAAPGASPVPYPAACRPQAWSAAAAVSVLATALGLEPGGPGDGGSRPEGSVSIDPIAALGTIEVDGLRFAGHRFAASAPGPGSGGGSGTAGQDGSARPPGPQG